MPLRRAVVSAALILASAPVARADDAADRKAARALLDAQIAALDDGDAVAYAATFVPDNADEARAVLVLPHADTVFAGIARITDEVRRWAPDGRMLGRARLIGDPAIAIRSSAAQITAELELTIMDKPRWRTEQVNGKTVTVIDTAHGDTSSLRMTALFVEHGGRWRAAAVMFSRPVDDKAMTTTRFAGYPGGGAGPLADLLDHPRSLAGAFDTTDADAIVIGTAPDERATGAAARALLRKWSRRRLQVIGDADGIDFGGSGYAAATVALKRGRTRIVLTALVIAHAALRTDGTKGWQVTSVHYGYPRR